MMSLTGTLCSHVAVLQAIPGRADRLAAFIGALRQDRRAALTLPPDDGSWGPLMVEFQFHGVTGSGPTPETAFTAWMDNARTLIAAERAVLTASGTTADLRQACLSVRTRSQNDHAIAAAARIERTMAMGLL